MNSEDVEKTVKDVRRYFDHDSQKQILKEKYEAKMLFAAFGGMWKASPDLLSINWHCQNLDEAVLVDEYGNPCKVNPNELYALALERWQEQMNAWHHEYQEMQKKR